MLFLQAMTGFPSSTTVVACDAEMDGFFGSAWFPGMFIGTSGAVAIEVVDGDVAVDASEMEDMTENSEGDWKTDEVEGVGDGGF